MEKEKTKFKQSKRKTQIGSNGGGNLGLLLFGGALAVGSLVATLAARKRKHSNCKQKQDPPSQGLLSSPDFHGNQCCASNGSTETVAAQVEQPQLVSTDSLEENLFSAVDMKSEHNDQEILLTHDIKQDSIEMCDSHCLAQLPELNILSLDQLDKDAKNDVATVEVAEEDAIDAAKMSTEEITSAKEEEDNNDKEEKKQAEESLPLEENTEVVEKEEPSTVKTGIGKEDDGNNSEKEIIEVKQEESLLLEENSKVVEKEEPSTVKTGVEKEDDGNHLEKEIIEVKQEAAAINIVEEVDAIIAAKISMEDISSVQSPDDEDENKQARETLLLDGEEELVGVKACAEITSLSTVHGNDDLKKGLPLMKTIEVEQETKDEVAENYAMDAVRMCIEEKSSMKSTEDDDEESEKKRSIDEKEDCNDTDERSDDEHVSNKSKEISGGTESSSQGPTADDIWPVEAPLLNAQISQVKTAEQDENNKTEDFNHFNSIENYDVNSCTDINRTRGNSTFTKKEENLEIAASNKQTTLHSRKWRISVQHMLIMASILLLHLTYFHVRSFLSSL